MLFANGSPVVGTAAADARTTATFGAWRVAMVMFAKYYQGFTKRPRPGLLGLTT